ncbi:MAG: ATP-binding cassette domain-containing protein [Frankiales bacterium]|nr:ATP-binding cassette domain-containing protein [Frankiales bacterium]
MNAQASAPSAVTAATPGRAATPGTLIEMHDVALTYGTGSTAVVAIHGATCQVATGARLTITGPSGSGKSTLLHLMAGLERPTTGSVTWPALGEDPLGRPGLVGVVFQGPSLIPTLDVAENVALPLVLAGTADRVAHELAMDALDTLEIDDLASKLPDELSGGQAQRVAIARAMATRPVLILADEPTGQLDRATGVHVIDVLLGAGDLLGAAVVISTHDPAVSDRLTTQWRIRDGVLSTTDSSTPHDRGVTR